MSAGLSVLHIGRKRKKQKKIARRALDHWRQSGYSVKGENKKKR